MYLNTDRLSPKLSWMLPYLISSIPLLPSNITLHRVGAWSITNKRTGLGRFGSCHDLGNGNYNIWLHTHQDPKNPTPLSKIDMLCTLAHELAHMTDMTHSPDHKATESKIVELFMSMLKDSGYTNEEDELNEFRCRET